MKKEKEVKEKKEIKETVKDYTIEKQDQKRLKGISKALYIIATIFKVVSIIGIVGILIAMIAVPIVTTNVKTLKDEDQHILRIFDHDFYYNRTNTTFEIYEKDKIDEKTEITKQSDVEAINKVFDYFFES